MPKIDDDQRRARRDDIVSAARRGLMRKAYAALTVDEICAEAGISKGGFYVHFASKHDLLVALVEDDAASLATLIDELESGDEPAIEKVRSLLRSLLERGADPGHAQARVDALAAMLSDDEVREAFVRSTKRSRRNLARWIDDAIEAGELVDVAANALAATLLALADGLMLHHAVDPGGFRWANVGRAVETLLGGAVDQRASTSAPDRRRMTSKTRRA